MNTFWFVKKTETLLFAQAYIEGLETEDVDLSNLEFKPDSSIPRPSILSILSAFVYSSPDNFRIALNLLFDYLEKQPENLPKVLHILVKDFGFKPTSFSSGSLMQSVVVDELRRRVGDDDELFPRLFIALAEKYLHISFETTKFKGDILNVIRFELPATPKLFELRRQLWEQVFQLYDNPRFQDGILSAIYAYSNEG